MQSRHARRAFYKHSGPHVAGVVAFFSTFHLPPSRQNETGQLSRIAYPGPSQPAALDLLLPIDCLDRRYCRLHFPVLASLEGSYLRAEWRGLRDAQTQLR